ncbi:RNB domain-containing ribonuclease, partial [Salmonella enterica subsp. enterica serovar Anatum]|nr:RNB domain-containing ribonuclease [Salmonella enterica subsp. enterica serovar Anatum]
ALFRIHDKPTTEAITSFRSVLAELGLELPGGNKPEPRDYAELLESIADRPDAEMLQTMLLRSMKQAIYDPENRGHFGLALQSYAHFTSPIRRYPDLSLHRAIKYLLAKEQGNKGNTTETGGYHYSMEEMLQLGQHCSMAERRADEATRDVSDWLKCDFMLDQVGNVFKGVIASVTGFGFFVRLDELFIDGLVHVSSLDNDYYRFDQVGQRLIGESGGQTYRLGDRVEVRVEAVNMDERKIDFSLISSERAPRNVGKTAREKAKKGESKNAGKRRQVGKKVNFEPDSAFRGEKKAKPKAAKKDARKAKKPSAKTQKIAAATKAKRAAKKKAAE